MGSYAFGEQAQQLHGAGSIDSMCWGHLHTSAACTDARGCSLDAMLCCCRDWHTGSLLCKQKTSADHLSSVVFTEDSSHVLAAGKASLKVSHLANSFLATSASWHHRCCLMAIKQTHRC